MRNEFSSEPFTLRRSQVAIEMLGWLQGLEPISPVTATVLPVLCRKEVIKKAPPLTPSPLSTEPLSALPKDLDMCPERQIFDSLVLIPYCPTWCSVGMERSIVMLP